MISLLCHSMTSFNLGHFEAIEIGGVEIHSHPPVVMLLVRPRTVLC